MIARIWHGYTTFDNANAYEQLIKTEVFPGISEKNIKGLKSAKLLKRETATETEFITILFFENIENIKALAGEDAEAAYVPEKARKILSRFDTRTQHFEMLHELNFEIKD
jgi:hypothetical protein